MKAIRWSDNDRYFGRFTYAHEPRRRQVVVMLGSGDGDDYPGCRLRLALGSHTLIIALPAIIKPFRKKVHYSTSDIRSEEHTSELQSLMRISYAVFCLKKKNKNSRTQKQT